MLRLTFSLEDAFRVGLGLCSLISSNPHCVVPWQFRVQLVPWHRRHLAAAPAAEAGDGFSGFGMYYATASCGTKRAGWLLVPSGEKIYSSALDRPLHTSNTQTIRVPAAAIT